MHVYSYVPGGYAGDLVSVEVDIRRGIPVTEIVGLPDNAIREARERVRVALRVSGLRYPEDRVLVNLAPAGVRKTGASFDLAIAVGILSASGQIDGPLPDRVLVLGELQLDATVRPVHDVLSAVASANEAGISEGLVPADNLREACALGRGRMRGVLTLLGALESLAEAHDGTNDSFGAADPRHRTPQAALSVSEEDLPDLSELRGQARLKRVLEVSAAGRHNLIAVGPPGSGKTMGIRALPSILPDLQKGEALEVTRIYSRAGLLDPRAGLFLRPPFRAPHHTASLPGIVGGGGGIMPGEASLAHRGVLFLDEAAEFRKNVLQGLREPTEERRIFIARAGRTYWYPANFQLVLAANPCPCGYFGHPTRLCTCSMPEIHRYWKRLGGPLVDRIELRVRVEPEALVDSEAEAPKGSNSAHQVRERVAEAVERQRHRFGRSGMSRNVEMRASEISGYLQASEDDLGVVREAAQKLSLSTRAMLSVLRVARTIADLEASPRTSRAHLLEAVQHRRLGEGGSWF